MRLHFVLSCLLGLFAWGTWCLPLGAEDFLPDEQKFVPEESGAARVDTLLNAPDSSDHAGLLGKVFMQQRYIQLPIDDPDIRQLDKSLQGFDTFVNLPVMTLDLPLALDFDVFFGYTNIGLKGSASTGPPLDIMASLNAKNEAYSVGTTIYPTQSERLRPFVQIGAQFSWSDVDFAISTPFGTFADNIVDHETKLLLNGGVEYDLLGYLGYRLTFQAETKDRFQDSIVTNELILWPHERIFVRGGIAHSLDSGRPGFAIGGGLAF